MLYQTTVSVKQSPKYHSKISARYKTLKLFNTDGQGKIMSRHVGCAFTFQYVGRHSLTLLPGLEALHL